MAVVADPFWVNKASGISPRNGTVTHTIDFGFVSSPGNFLLFIVAGAVTHTNAGWTERLSPVTSGELSVFTKTSTGESQFVDTVNGSNYTVSWMVFELPAGTTWVNGAQANQIDANRSTILTVGSLPGTEVVCFAGREIVDARTGTPAEVTTVWPGSWIEEADISTFLGAAATDGIHLTLARQINITATTSPGGTITVSNTPGTSDSQWVAFALDVAAIEVPPPPSNVSGKSQLIAVGRRPHNN